MIVRRSGKSVVVSVVSGGENGGHERRTSHERISIKNRVRLCQDAKQLERPRTTQSQLLSTDYSN